MAVRTKSAAGRAWRSTSDGSATVVSEFCGTTSLLCGTDDVLEPDAGAGRDRGGDGALDDGRVGEPHVAVGPAGEQRADGEDGGAEVAEHADAATAAARTRDRVAHAVLVGAQAAVGPAARRLDGNGVAGHLRGQLRDPPREAPAGGFDP